MFTPIESLTNRCSRISIGFCRLSYVVAQEVMWLVVRKVNRAIHQDGNFLKPSKHDQ